MAKKTHGATGAMTGQAAKMNEPVDQSNVTSKVSVSGKKTKRTYSDGAVQEQTWTTEQQAKDYAASVRALEGDK